MDTRFLTICDTCGRTILKMTPNIMQICACKLNFGLLWDDTVKEGHSVPPQVDRTKEG